jgi:phage terminase small subunit
MQIHSGKESETTMAEKYPLLQDILDGKYGEEVKEALEGLSEKQKFFCMEYTKDMNATQAAIRAGYSEKTAYSQGPRLLENVGIRKVIDALLAKRAKDIELDENWVLKRFKEISDRCMQKEPVKEWDEEAKEWKESGIWKFDSTGANRATENIGKILGMFIDRKEIKDVTPGREMSLEDMKRLMQLIEAEKAQK